MEKIILVNSASRPAMELARKLQTAQPGEWIAVTEEELKAIDNKLLIRVVEIPEKEQKLGYPFD